ncbi:MAG TPA: helix-turn-helix domain-containing protein [Weissella cibaria]|nr:helix-turn-helix domain-containing protein [Weissella cibaria]
MNRIKELRKEKGLTLDELSEKVGINRATLNRYENEKSEPKLDTWKKLAAYFDVPVSYLQGLTEYATFEPIKALAGVSIYSDEYKDFILKQIEKHKETDALSLSKKLSTLMDEKTAKLVDENLSGFDDRVLVSHVLNGIDTSVYQLLISDLGLKKYRQALVEASKALDAVNEKLSDIATQGYKNSEDDELVQKTKNIVDAYKNES